MRRVAPHAGAWIEISDERNAARVFPSRPTRARGLKWHSHSSYFLPLLSRPTRARGLKYLYLIFDTGSYIVAPHAGAWIEILGVRIPQTGRGVAPHAGAWIEILKNPSFWLSE